MNSKKGFTLLEMLVVIGIIAILGGVMLAQFSGSTESALATSCMNNMRSLCNAVMADGSKESRYPAAGPYQYIYIDDKGNSKRPWFQGWIGHSKGEQKVSCYQSDKEGEQQHYAITNGTIWRGIGGQESAYVCPTHLNCCKRGKKPTPSWSYVMNSYFGWDYGIAGSIELGRRGYGGGLFTFSYSDGSRKRPVEKVLLFAEIPYAENGVLEPKFSTSAATENDAILQYEPDSGENKKSDKTANGSSEVIGFNHKSGKTYSAHVAFADGHCAKLMLPTGADKGNLMELTTWLCTGQEYTFNGSRYEKVSE